MKFPITPKGLEKLKQKLQELKAERPDVAKAIEEARAHGDLSENADYDAAKNYSGMLEAKIRDCEAQITNSNVIDPSKITNPEKVIFGVSVKIEDLDSGEQKKLTIYGPAESDTANGIISIDTPLAKALMGKSVGDVAEFKMPGNQREYEILDISVE